MGMGMGMGMGMVATLANEILPQQSTWGRKNFAPARQKEARFQLYSDYCKF